MRRERAVSNHVGPAVAVAPDRDCGYSDGEAELMDVGQEISAAMAGIEAGHLEERYRDQYRAALRLLRTIPSGTRDEDLTDDQREAWRVMDELTEGKGKT